MKTSTLSSDRILFCFGLFLFSGEAYKQFFLYYIINHRAYDWWYFPFQLCSLPMYFCLLIPFLRDSRKKAVLCTFMQDYNILGGIAALAVPEGFSHIHWSLTLHGYLWHITLIILGLYIFIKRLSDQSLRGYFHTLPIFVVCCLIATVINLIAPGKTADMFYISPWYPSTQPVFHALSMIIGTLPGHMLYLTCICLLAFLIHQFFFRLYLRSFPV